MTVVSHAIGGGRVACGSLIALLVQLGSMKGWLLELSSEARCCGLHLIYSLQAPFKSLVYGADAMKDSIGR